MEKSMKMIGRRKKGRMKLKTRETIALTIMCLVPACFVIAFSYVPMFGIVLAFKSYRFDKGIWGSDWNGFKNFDVLLKSGFFGRLLRNTVGMNLLFIVAGTLAALAVAILLYEVKKRIKVKIYQTLMLLPYFISWVIVAYIAYSFLNPSYGVLNQFLMAIGFDKVDWYGDPKYWPWILTFFSVWKGVGYSSIVYYAALMGIDSAYFEAARIDGATKWQEIKYVTLPSLIPIITIQSILAVGGIMRADFGLFYQIPRNVGMLYPATDVLDTYIYRALMEQNNVGLSSATGFFQSVGGCILVLFTNWIVTKIEPDNALI